LGTQDHRALKATLVLRGRRDYRVRPVLWALRAYKET